ncbi:MAG: hypothetical protein ACP5MZ_03500 [Candidatus Micrarchaeia archaeon]
MDEQDTTGMPSNINGQQGFSPGPEQPAQPQQPSTAPSGASTHSSRARLIISTVVLLIVLVGIVYYSLGYFASVTHVPTTIPVTNTTVVNTTTTVSTTTINTTTTTIKVEFNPYNLSQKQYALYGIPNISQFQTYTLEPSSVPSESYSVGAQGGYLSEFGLNFTYNLIAGPTELPWNYDIKIPPQYINDSYPVGVIIQVFNFSNATNAARFLLYDQYYNKTINDSLNGPIPRVNNTVKVYMPLNGYAFLTNISSYNNVSAFYQTTLTHNFTSINGTPIIIVLTSPMYQTMNQYLIGFQYNNYVVFVTGYGIYGHLNISHPLSTVSYMLQSLRS